MINCLDFGEDARFHMLEGILTLAEAVSVTLGPKGKNVIYTDEYGLPVITKDGVSIISKIEGQTPIDDLGIKIIRQAAQQTVKDAGDGTTTATLLAAKMYELGLKSGISTIQLKREMDGTVKTLIKELKKQATVCKSKVKIQQVATVSANNDVEIGKLIAAVYDKVGSKGILTVEQGHMSKDEVNIVTGLKIKQGMLSPYFITNLKGEEAELDNCYVLLIDGTIDYFPDLAPLIETVMKTGSSLLIMATDIKKSIVSTLARNKVEGNLKVSAVQLPRDSFTLENIAAFTGAKLIALDLGDKLVDLNTTVLGRCKKVITGRSYTLFQEGFGNTEERIKELQTMGNDRALESIAALTGGIGVIRAGGNSPVEIQERVMRIEDALLATKAAIVEGVVVGGGSIFKHLYEKFKGLNEIVISALPIIQDTLQKNADSELNLSTEVLKEQGVFEPVKVIRCALENAVSVAGMLLTTECVITKQADPNVHQLFLRSEE